MIKYKGERYLPWVDDPIVSYEHLHRYRIAIEFLKGKKVLDLACGEGYGSFMFAEEAISVVSIDIDEECIIHASAKYLSENLRFIVGSVLEVPIKGESIFDVIVCFEFLEHIEEHDQLMKEVKRLLRDDGLFIVSTPNKHIYSDEADYKNPFHLKELYLEDFKILLNDYFKNTIIYGQQVYPASNIFPLDRGSAITTDFVIDKDDEAFYFDQPERKEARYFIAIASNSSLIDIKGNSYLVDASATLFKQKDARIGGLEVAISDRDAHIESLVLAISDKDARIEGLEVAISDRDAQIEGLEVAISDRDAHIESLEVAVRDKENTLNIIYSSIGWKILTFYNKVEGKIFPANSTRRRIARFTVNFFKKIKLRIDRLYKQFEKPSVEEYHTTLKTTVEEIVDLEFPVFDEPKVSIIIPVWNKWEFTYNCFQSLLVNTVGVPYETIIVDNASTDETPKMLAKVKNIRVKRMETNLGFIEACNISTQDVQGEYLLFLNNDTLVTKRWLISMLELIEGDETFGAVGPKLIYPDGKLQEAGGIIWSDESHSAWNFGKYGDPDRYEYNYVKEVDYCSGACLLVRKGLFDKIGGFDSRFSPAYWEDADMAFSIRKLGYKVLYQPKAEVIHYEGITAGTDTSQNIKRFQVVNQEKFYEKWGDTLKEDLCRNGNEVFLARDRSQKKRVMLFVDHYVPTYDKDAGSFITFEYLKIFLEMGFKIIFWPDNLLKMEPYVSELQQMGIEVVYGSAIFSEYIRKNGQYIDVACIARPHIAIKYIDKIIKNSKAKIVYFPVDLHFLREQRRAKIENDQGLLVEANKFKSSEFFLMEYSNVTVVYSDVEKGIIEQENPKINVSVWPWIQPLDIGKKPFNEKKDLIFIGGFDHLPNQDAVLWFVEEIFPLIKKEIPEVKFYIIGSNPTQEVSKLNSADIIVAGFVKDVTPFFQNAKVFVAPLRYGAGFKGKIIKAMSYGLPVVTTYIGAEGMGLKDGENVMIVDEPKEFAEKVLVLYKNESEWKYLAENSVMFVEENNSAEAAKRKFEKFFDELWREQ